MKDSDIKKTQITKRLLCLAYLGECLGREALHMPPLTMAQWYRQKGLHHWDCTVEELLARFEIKIWSDNHTIHISCSQLAAQKKELEAGFPFNDGFLFFFTYRNRKTRGKRKGSLLAQKGTTVTSLSRFVVNQISHAYVIDTRLIHGIWKRDGEFPWKKDADNIYNVVRLKRRDLRGIANNMPESLRALGIPEEEIPRWLPPGAKRSRRRLVEVSMKERWEPRVAHRERPIFNVPESISRPRQWNFSFPLLVLAENGFKRRFLRRLNGTVKGVLKD